MSRECERVEERLLSFLEGEAPSGEEERIRRHLESCPHCSERAERMNVVRGWLGALPRKRIPVEALDGGAAVPLLFRMPEEKLPPGFEARVRAALKALGAEGESASSSGRPEGHARGRVRPLYQALAAAAVLVVAGVLSFRTVESAPPRGERIRVRISRSLYRPLLGSLRRSTASPSPWRGAGDAGRKGRFGGPGGER